jgi:hypothetical protein
MRRTLRRTPYISTPEGHAVSRRWWSFWLEERKDSLSNRGQELRCYLSNATLRVRCSVSQWSLILLWVKYWLGTRHFMQGTAVRTKFTNRLHFVRVNHGRFSAVWRALSVRPVPAVHPTGRTGTSYSQLPPGARVISVSAPRVEMGNGDSSFR